MYNDPSGEFAFIPILLAIGKAALIGAAVGLASYTIGLAVTGNLHQWNIGGALKATFWGAVGGAVSFGVGEIFNIASQAGKLTQIGTFLQKNIGEVGLSIVQAGTHAVSQATLSVMQGGSFEQAFWSGALGSLGASAFGAVAGNFANSTVGTIAFGAISGGIGAELSGGNFWEGAVIGGMVAGLNHAMHRSENDDEWMLTKDGRIIKVGNKGGDTTDYLYDEFTYAQTTESRTLLATADVQNSTVTTGSFSSGGYPVKKGFGYRVHTQFGGHSLYDPSFDIMTNVPLSGGITLTKFGLTRLSKSAYGLSVGLGGSKTMLKSSYLFSRTPLNFSMGFRLPTIMGVSTNNLGVFLGRNSALIGAGSATYGGYRFINKRR